MPGYGKSYGTMNKPKKKPTRTAPPKRTAKPKRR